MQLKFSSRSRCSPGNLLVFFVSVPRHSSLRLLPTSIVLADFATASVTPGSLLSQKTKLNTGHIYITTCQTSVLHNLRRILKEQHPFRPVSLVSVAQTAIIWQNSLYYTTGGSLEIFYCNETIYTRPKTCSSGFTFFHRVLSSLIQLTVRFTEEINLLFRAQNVSLNGFFLAL